MLIDNKQLHALSLLSNAENLNSIKIIIKDYMNWSDSNTNTSVENYIQSRLKNGVYEIIEMNGNDIKAIKKISTDEIFRTGDSFWCTNTYEHDPQSIINGGYKINNLSFDEYLTGYTFSNKYYINYVRGNSGIYSLNEIMTIDKYNSLIKHMSERDWFNYLKDRNV